VYKLAFGPKAFIVVSDPVVVRHILKVPAGVCCPGCTLCCACRASTFCCLSSCGCPASCLVMPWRGTRHPDQARAARKEGRAAPHPGCCACGRTRRRTPSTMTRAFWQRS